MQKLPTERQFLLVLIEINRILVDLTKGFILYFKLDDVATSDSLEKFNLLNHILRLFFLFYSTNLGKTERYETFAFELRNVHVCNFSLIRILFKRCGRNVF